MAWVSCCHSVRLPPPQIHFSLSLKHPPRTSQFTPRLWALDVLEYRGQQTQHIFFQLSLAWFLAARDAPIYPNSKPCPFTSTMYPPATTSNLSRRISSRRLRGIFHHEQSAYPAQESTHRVKALLIALHRSRTIFSPIFEYSMPYLSPEYRIPQHAPVGAADCPHQDAFASIIRVGMRGSQAQVELHRGSGLRPLATQRACTAFQAYRTVGLRTASFVRRSNPISI